MNVLRFSIQLRTQFMREECLKEQEENESILDENINSIENETTIAQNVDSTGKWRRRFESKMINKCSNPKELSFFHHQSTVIRLVNILLGVGETILIGGIMCFWIVGLVNNCYRFFRLKQKMLNNFMKKLIGKTNLLKVPQNRINDRFQDPPKLRRPTVEILGIGEAETT
ncbi:unnamed protein product [Rotaria socialis]|uniref:Uncharacterized protein n=1 Tax=Rotaria socialis TaxID=392032 RepID=A0A820W6W4_9BILA|nr:unnamed protein product [Rotaria socialis]